MPDLRALMNAGGWTTLRQENEKAAAFYRFDAMVKQQQGLAQAALNSDALARKLTDNNFWANGALDNTYVAPYAQHDYNGAPLNLAEAFGINAQASAIREQAGRAAMLPEGMDWKPGSTGALRGIPNARLYNNGVDMGRQTGSLGPYATQDVNEKYNRTEVLDRVNGGIKGWINMPNQRQQSNDPGMYYSANNTPEAMPYVPFDNSDQPTESGTDILNRWGYMMGQRSSGGSMTPQQWLNDPRNPYAGLSYNPKKGAPSYARRPPKNFPGW